MDIGGGNINRDQFRYFDSVPHLIFPYMEGWTDVRSDGNCGFRCVADAFHGSEENYLVVRRIVANELMANSDLYSYVYGGPQFVMEAVIRINWTGGRCGSDHWMEVVFNLFPIANLYNCALMLYSYRNNRSLYPCYTVCQCKVRKSLRLLRLRCTLPICKIMPTTSN